MSEVVVKARRTREMVVAAAEPAELAGVPAELQRFAVDDRVTVRRGGDPDARGEAVVYWMQRAERGRDNAALECAVGVANALGLPLVVYFAGIANFPHANLRHYVFLNEGLRDVAADLAERNISFVLRNAPREDHLQMFADVKAAMVIGDENPMRVPESWRVRVAEAIRVPFWTVDADVVVPSRRLEKAPYAAYTIRKRLWKMVPAYVVACANAHALHAWKKPRGFVEDDVAADMTAGWEGLDRTVGAAPGWTGGRRAAEARLQHFVEKLLARYDADRNHPERDATSRLSPYLHFGHIGPVTVMLAVEAAVAERPELRGAANKFFDELVTWRELCIAWVKYDAHYDGPETAEPWAQKTIAEHAGDVRESVYTLRELDEAKTHDPLWNAAQRQMVYEGWMPNFLRMYWAKKVLEWSADNATAQQQLIYLNDRYFLDGRDPGGYAGIAWAVYGKFDRPWGERKVFGKIRYMSLASTGRKFDSKGYVGRWGGEVSESRVPKAI